MSATAGGSAGRTVEGARPAPAPIPLAPHYVARFYRGGDHLGAFRASATGPYEGEDWIGSTTRAHGGTHGLGLTVLEDGRALQDLIAADPVGYLGSAHVAEFGAHTELLVKLLDPGERLAVHYHPSRGFAREHLGCVHGKTEAWLVLRAPEDGAVHLGFQAEVAAGDLRRWVDRQDVAVMLDALNRVPVRPGDAVLVPAGVPHAIGAGVFLVELQEPADWSLMLERAGVALGAAATWHLGLGADVALSAVDRSAWTPDRLARLRLPAPVPRHRGVARLLPELADPFFRAESVAGGARLEPSFALFVGVEGALHLATASGHTVELAAGQTLLMPHGCGACTVTGAGRAIRCLPPLAPEVFRGEDEGGRL